MKALRKPLSLFMALLMCLGVFVGTGTTAFAAGETMTTYMIDLPRANDPNKAGWGHPALNFLGGWSTGENDSFSVHTQDAFNGRAIYCIEPGVGVNTGDQYTGRGEDFWDNYPSNLNPTIPPDTIKEYIGRIMTYGWQGNASTSWMSGDPEDASKIAGYIATQLLVWETVVGERDSQFNHVDANAQGKNNVTEYISADHPLYSEIFNQYSAIESAVKRHTMLPSFFSSTADAGAYELKWDGQQYSLTLTDTNGVLSDYTFSSSTTGLNFSVDGNQLTITSAQAIKGSVTVKAEKISAQRSGVVVWTDGITGGGKQDFATYGETVSDSMVGYLNLEVKTGNMKLIKTSEDGQVAGINFTTPEVEYHNIVAQPTEHQQEMVKTLSERASLVHSGTVDPSQDNMLKITSDGRKLGLDQRIVNQMLPDEPGTKVNQCVDNIMQIWRDGKADKLTQLVFCDISTPQAKAPASKAAKTLDNPLLHALEGAVPLPEQEPTFTVYDDIRQKLIAQGMPADQIAFIHEANTEVRKKELFSKVRTGQVRVLLGSTAKMGAGTNVQDRLVALHDLDCPWRPGDLAQRKGRIERQGNQNPLVHVYRYVTEGTFDAYLWQTVENKQKFISQIMTSKSPVRSCDDVDETALSFAEIKALCAGDPRIKERMDLDVEVSRLKLMKADHQSKQYRLEDQLLKYFPEEIEKHKGFIKGFESDLEVLAAHPHPEDGFAGMEIRGDLLTDKENAGAALLDACKEVKTSDPVQIGSYRGYAMSVEFSAWKQEYTLLLKGQMTHRATLGTDPRGNLTRIDNALAQMPQRLEAAKAQLDNLYQQQAAAKEEVGKPFLYEEELRSKNARLVELDTLLNIDGKGPAHDEAVVAKSTRPSVLDHLKRPVPPRSTDKKPKQHEEVR